MHRPIRGLLSQQRGVAALAAASLALLLSGTARASDTDLPSSEQASPNAGASVQAACDSACVAQQALETALHTPLRLGSGRVELRVGSTKWTIGWALAF